MLSVKSESSGPHFPAKVLTGSSFRMPPFWAALAIHNVGTGSRLSPGYLGEDWLYEHMFRRPYLLLLPAFTPASSLLYPENHSLVTLN